MQPTRLAPSQSHLTAPLSPSPRPHALRLSNHRPAQMLTMQRSEAPLSQPTHPSSALTISLHPRPPIANRPHFCSSTFRLKPTVGRWEAQEIQGSEGCSMHLSR